MKDFHILLNELGIHPKNEELYIQALTHPSYQNEVDKNRGNYQRLEFLGDAVLELIVSNYIFFNFKDMDEGNMTLLRTNLVNEEPLFEMAQYFNLGDYIFLGHGEILSHGNDKSSLVSDVFESLLAAIYLDLGYKVAEKFAVKNVKRYIKEKGINYILLTLKDPKTKLQELVQAESRKGVTWESVQESGTANNPVFKSKVLVDGIVLGEGTGSSKQKAEKKAAQDALRKMVK